MKIEGSRILITGGTGSFGHRVARHLLERNPAGITIFSRDEKKQDDMRKEFPDFHFVIGDVRDSGALRQALRGVNAVFHAAALKQVPNCELWPVEAVKTNTLGAINLCQAALECGVEQVVALSTDKAVKPVNAMGMSKAMMEKILGQFGRSSTSTVFSCVRYGNVMGSRGSVIPFFLKRMEQGKTLPLTVPGMTRFMLTLDEAVLLVFHALEHAQGGEIFVRKAPACTVGFLAEAMIRKYGGGKEIPTEVIGMRVGEKLHEVLVNEYEMLRVVDQGEFFAVPPEEDGTHVSGNAREAEEYRSDNTRQITTEDELSALLDRALPDVERGA